ncbi:MAG: GGDEF domain-containing protein [Pseudomonadota bacterium]
MTFFLTNKADLSERVSQSYLASSESVKHLTNLKTYVKNSQPRILNAIEHNSVDNYKFYLTYSARIEQFTETLKNNQSRYLKTSEFEAELDALTKELKNHPRIIDVIYKDYSDSDLQNALIIEKEAEFGNTISKTLDEIQGLLTTSNTFQGTHSVTLAQLHKEQISVASYVLAFFLCVSALSLIYLSYVYALSQLHLRALYRHSEHPIITLNKGGSIVHLNKRASLLFYASEIVRNKTHMRDLLGFQWDEVQKKLMEYQRQKSSLKTKSNNAAKIKPSSNDYRIEHTITISDKNNTRVHYKLGIIVIRSLSTYRAVITFVDQTLLMTMENRTQRDTFTNLTNKTGILNQLSSEIERAKRHHTTLSVVFIDIDGFKGINDKYGHQFGDKVIKWVAKRISNRVRDTDYLGRFGGDEFVLVCPDCRANQADSIAEDIRKLLKSPKLHIKASFGIAEMDPRDTRTSLLNRADKALYHAKSSGKDTVVVSH